jgi:hypothetical protein
MVIVFGMAAVDNKMWAKSQVKILFVGNIVGNRSVSSGAAVILKESI